MSLMPSCLWLLSVGESRARSSPARTSEQVSSQQSRSSMDADPLGTSPPPPLTAKKNVKKILFTLCPLFNLQCFFAGDADLMEKQKKQTSNPHIELREFVVGCFFCFSFHSYCLSAVLCPLSTLIFLIIFFPSCRIFRRQCQVLLPNLLRCRVSQNA